MPTMTSTCINVSPCISAYFPFYGKTPSRLWMGGEETWVPVARPLDPGHNHHWLAIAGEVSGIAADD